MGNLASKASIYTFTAHVLSELSLIMAANKENMCPGQTSTVYSERHFHVMEKRTVFVHVPYWSLGPKSTGTGTGFISTHP